MLLKVAQLYWDLLLINLIDIRFLLEQEIRKSFFFVSYVLCGFVYGWEESRLERDFTKSVDN